MKCREEGCNQPPHQYGRCIKCHRARYAAYASARNKRVKQYREEFGRNPIYLKPTECMVEGCVDPIHKIGRCIDHYRERERTRRREWASKNRDKTRAYFYKYYWNNAEKQRTKSAKSQKAKRVLVKSSNSSWSTKQRVLSREWRERVRARKLGCVVYEIKNSEMLRLYSSPCFYCGSIHDITVDHVIPLSRGGSHSIGNLVPACSSCNSSKNAKFIVEFLRWKRNITLISNKETS